MAETLNPIHIYRVTSQHIFRLVQGKVKVGAVNCDEEKSLCSQFGVQGFPTVKWFGSNKQAPEDYRGERTAAALSDFALKQWGKTAPPPEACFLTAGH